MSTERIGSGAVPDPHAVPVASPQDPVAEAKTHAPSGLSERDQLETSFKLSLVRIE